MYHVHLESLIVQGMIPSVTQQVKLRKTITDDVVAGNVAEAIQLADTLAPGMLAANPSLTFRLHLQTFFELVRTLESQQLSSFGLAVSHDLGSDCCIDR